MSIFVSRNIKNMICSNRYSAGTIAALCLFMSAACSKAGQDPVPSPSVLSVDITEAVVIHPSSLKYFDYVISYMDNTGQQYVDTVSDASSLIGSYIFNKTYCYSRLPLACTSRVELVPKVPRTEVVSFTFIEPKPYLYSNVYSSDSGIPDNSGDLETGRYGEIPVESMTIGDFLLTYGNSFITTCIVRNNPEGI